jgi:hypothetical protein
MRSHIITTLLLTAALVGSAGCGPSRAYDAQHSDYHQWDDHEDRAYRGYLAEQHRDYRDFKTLDRSDQDGYWQWRHAHPDR